MHNNREKRPLNGGSFSHECTSVHKSTGTITTQSGGVSRDLGPGRIGAQCSTSSPYPSSRAWKRGWASRKSNRGSASTRGIPHGCPISRAMRVGNRDIGVTVSSFLASTGFPPRTNRQVRDAPPPPGHALAKPRRLRRMSFPTPQGHGQRRVSRWLVACRSRRSEG